MIPDLVDVEGLYGRVESEVLIVGEEGSQHGVHAFGVLVGCGWCKNVPGMQFFGIPSPTEITNYIALHTAGKGASGSELSRYVSYAQVLFLEVHGLRDDLETGAYNEVTTPSA